MLVREVILWLSLLAIGISLWLVAVDLLAIWRAEGWRARLWWAGIAGSRFFVALAFFVLAQVTYGLASVPWTPTVIAYTVSLGGYALASFCSLIALHPLEMDAILWAESRFGRRAS